MTEWFDSTFFFKKKEIRKKVEPLWIVDLFINSIGLCDAFNFNAKVRLLYDIIAY